MPHTTIAPNGTISYRTKLMMSVQAAAFAKCVKANSRFCDVAICESKTRNGKQFVEFRPANIERQRDMYQAEWNKNEARADEQGADFIFWQDPDNADIEWVFNPHSGETHQMFKGRCQCPQQVYRCEPAALLCKHMIEKDRRAAAGTLGKTDKVTRRWSHEEFAARVAADFP